jgi:hypothetical protein
MLNLSTASKELRHVAKENGIRSGQWEPVGQYAGSLAPNVPPSTVMARVTNGRKTIEVTAHDLATASFTRHQ